VLFFKNGRGQAPIAIPIIWRRHPRSLKVESRPGYEEEWQAVERRMSARQLRKEIILLDLFLGILAPPQGTRFAQDVALIRGVLTTDQQLADRFEAWELPPWQDNPALQQLLASLAAILPLRRASELNGGQDPVLTEGVMVRICRLVEAAAILAIETEHEHINLQTT